ncbi:MAG: uncharacterized protein QOI14_738 [Actinomycetota bacterium]|nr:uncharacterized protein [Actinomycetota bacterium]
MTSKPATLTVLVSGASGFIGSELVRQLEVDGHTVRRLVRSQPRTAEEFRWSPDSGEIDASALESVDAVVNLSGASTGRLPWTRGYKKQILASRVNSTGTLVRAIVAAKNPPAVLLNGSAVGIYGDRPGEKLTEKSVKGDGFLAEVVDRWESAARLETGLTRVVTFRTGVVVGQGGAFTPLLLLTKIGLGARFGTGAQNWPWISLHDEAAAIRHLLTSTLSGPVNLAGPTPATSNDVTSYLARRLHRWYLFAIPRRLITFLLRDAGRDLLLTSEDVAPDLLLADGFTFTHRTVRQAIDAAFGG